MCSQMYASSLGAEQKRINPRMNMEISVKQDQKIPDYRSYYDTKSDVTYCLTRNISHFMAKSRCEKVSAICLTVGLSEFAAVNPAY